MGGAAGELQPSNLPLLMDLRMYDMMFLGVGELHGAAERCVESGEATSKECGGKALRLRGLGNAGV